MAIDKDILDRLLKDYKSPEDLLGPGGLLKQLTGALVERALETEMTDHLGYEKHKANGAAAGNSRNGKTKKTLRTDEYPQPVRHPFRRPAPRVMRVRRLHKIQDSPLETHPQVIDGTRLFHGANLNLPQELSIRSKQTYPTVLRFRLLGIEARLSGSFSICAVLRHLLDG